MVTKFIKIPKSSKPNTNTVHFQEILLHHFRCRHIYFPCNYNNDYFPDYICLIKSIDKLHSQRRCKSFSDISHHVKQTLIFTNIAKHRIETFTNETEPGTPHQIRKLPILQYMDEFNENLNLDGNSVLPDNQSVMALINPNDLYNEIVHYNHEN